MLLVELVFVATLSLTTVQAARSGDCVIKINDPAKLSRPQPLLLRSDTQLFTAPRTGVGFYLPDAAGHVVVPAGAVVRLACPGQNNYFSVFRQTKENNRIVKHVLAKCIGGVSFEIEDKIKEYTELFCNENPFNTAKVTTDKCGKPENGIKINIGFEVENDFFIIMENCFNPINLKTIYSKYDLVSGIKGQMSMGPRRPKTFKIIPGYSNIGMKMDDLYNRDKQRIAINEILHVPVETPSKYISDSCFLNRGHLTAAGDFVYVSEKRATFYYVNVAPQWTRINDGNWKELEDSLQDLASKTGRNLQVFTGSHGVMTLQMVEIYLSLVEKRGSKKHPVPEVFWKVAYDPRSKKGVAVVTLNNPYVDYKYDDFLVKFKAYCDVECDNLKWFRNWSRENKIKGYTCCSNIAHFAKVVESLPQLEVNGLLDI